MLDELRKRLLNELGDEVLRLGKGLPLDEELLLVEALMLIEELLVKKALILDEELLLGEALLLDDNNVNIAEELLDDRLREGKSSTLLVLPVALLVRLLDEV
jgi:hypothetical protein